jgi:Tfp pilus assembly protein PilF
MMRWRWMLVVMLLAAGCATTRSGGRVARAQLALAHELAARRDWPSLMQAVERMHAQGKRTAETLTLRASAYRGQGLTEEAQADLRAAVAMDARHAPAHAALAVILDLKGKADEAERHHRRALDLDPDNAEYLNDWGFALYVRGRTSEAVEVLRRAIDGASLVSRHRNNLGFAYARSGDFVRAAEQFALAGPRAEARNNLGFGYELADNLPQAFEAYLEAVRLDPSLKPARTNLAHVAQRLHRPLPPELSAPLADDRSSQ